MSLQSVQPKLYFRFDRTLLRLNSLHMSVRQWHLTVTLSIRQKTDGSGLICVDMGSTSGWGLEGKKWLPSWLLCFCFVPFLHPHLQCSSSVSGSRCSIYIIVLSCQNTGLDHSAAAWCCNLTFAGLFWTHSFSSLWFSCWLLWRCLVLEV